jgi:integrase
MPIVGLDLAGVETSRPLESPRHLLNPSDTARARPNQKNEQLIITTLLNLKANGREPRTLDETNYRLTRLGRMADLNNPQEVKMAIANMTTSNGDKDNYVKCYQRLCTTHEIQWKRPHYKVTRRIPTIPTKENIMKIVANARKFSTIFKTLMETGLMPYELSKVEQRDVDLERGILNARGYKGHTSRAFKLTMETTAMLKAYFTKYGKFPTSEYMQDAWAKTKNKIAQKLQDPTLKTIRLYDLRHYYATMLYNRTRDILLVKQQLGQSKIETTMIYTQLIHLDDEEEYTTKATKDINEAIKLLDTGYTYVQEMDGFKLYRKRK